MPGALRLGTVAGIPLAVHYSWLLIAALITLSLGGQFRSSHSDWSATVIWLTSALTAVLFFATLLMHELAHSIVARAHGLPVRSITLFALGGVATIEKDATSPKTEFLIAIAGPVVSFAIGFGCIGLARSLGWSLNDGGTGIAGSVLGWLGSINVVLAVFNLIPGYPLDGGRVLRAALWAAYKDVSRATRNAARAGEIVAGIFIGWGLLRFFLSGGFGGLWLVFLGWFLMMAARASRAEVTIGEALQGVLVADVMSNDYATTGADLSIQQLVDEVLLRTGRRCIIVKSGGDIVGVVTPHEIRDVARDRWVQVRVAEIMRPLDKLPTVGPRTSVVDALKAMARENVNQLPVVADGQFEGVVTRGHILQLLDSRSELKAA